jgi:hypothetical protein
VKRNTKKVGDLSELMVMAAFLDNGYTIAKPFGENARYDFLADKDGYISRVQVKSGWLRRGVVTFSCESSHYHRGGCARGYLEQADVFGVYCRDSGAVYVIPVGEVGRRGSFRLAPTRNGQRSGVRWAEDHVVAKLTPPELVGLPLWDGVANAGAPL